MIKNILSVSFLFLACINADAAAAALTIGSKGDEMAFNKTQLTANAGTVTITFKNNATVDSGMQHNFVLTKPGTQTDTLGSAGISAGAAKDYLPDSAAIIKHTAMLEPGKSETLSVDLTPGVYPYYCSFPGHPATMKGTLTVK